MAAPNSREVMASRHICQSWAKVLNLDNKSEHLIYSAGQKSEGSPQIFTLGASFRNNSFKTGSSIRFPSFLAEFQSSQSLIFFFIIIV